jgi:Restriction endonuclease NaeI
MDTTARSGADRSLDEVYAALAEAPSLEQTFAYGIRQAIDEVIDGPRTGRFSFAELEKTEKTYVGTRIEIVVRSALGLERIPPLDTVVAGHPLDIKWSATQGWMIPTEAVGQLCLLVGTRRQGGEEFDVGLMRCTPDVLSAGSNKDKKRSLSAYGRSKIRWLINGGMLEPNFLATLPSDIVAKVLNEKTGQARLRRLFLELPPGTPVPRLAAATLGQQYDPMRRLRADRKDTLGGLKVMSGRYTINRDAAVALGYGEIPGDCFIAVPRAALEQLPTALRAKLKVD